MEHSKLKDAEHSYLPSVQCEHLVSSPEDDFRYRIHNEFEIFLFLRGDVNYIVEQHIYPLRPGDVLILNSTELHYPSFISDAEFERIVLHFNPILFQQISTPRTQLLNQFFDHNPGERNLIRLPVHALQSFYSLALQVVQECQSETWGDDVRAVLHLAEMLLLLKQGEVVDISSGSLSPYVHQVLQYINNTLPASISLADVAQALSVDRFHLNKVFKKEMGTTVYNYVLLKRLNLARSFLIQGESVGDACTKAGFNDYTNFIRTFKKYTGVTPSTYARLALYVPTHAVESSTSVSEK